MEFWEGAILVVGGVWLVSYMANKNKVAQQTVIGTSTLGAAGTSNQSNLTTITNTAGGTPTIYGEPIESPNPPMGVPVRPPIVVSPTPIRTPIAYPVLSPRPIYSPVHSMMLPL